jgi:ABC-2 type transport system permease protein
MAEAASLVARPVGNVRSLLALYRAQMRIAIVGTLQYRVYNVVELVLMLSEPLVYLMVWRIVAEEQGGEVDGFTPARFAAYYIAW